MYSQQIQSSKVIFSINKTSTLILMLVTTKISMGVKETQDFN